MAAWRIGGWRVERRLAVGAAAEVFLVHPAEERPDESAGAGPLRVLKRLLPVYAEERDLVEAFEREAALGPLLAHENLPRLHSHGWDDGVPFLVIDYLRGCSLQQLMAVRERPLPAGVALAVARDVACALDHLHGLRSPAGEPMVIAHRDVTPANVVLTHEGRAVLIDFGLVTGAVARRETTSNVIKGTWRYAAPEQLSGGRVSAASDVYAVGALLHLLVSGRPPFDAVGDLEDIFQAKRTLHLEAPGAPPEIVDLVRAATAVEPGERIATARQLQSWIEGLGPAPRDAVREAVGEDMRCAEARAMAKALAEAPRPSAEQRGEETTDPGRPDVTRVGTSPLIADGPPSALVGLVALLLAALAALLALLKVF